VMWWPSCSDVVAQLGGCGVSVGGKWWPSWGDVVAQLGRLCGGSVGAMWWVIILFIFIQFATEHFSLLSAYRLGYDPCNAFYPNPWMFGLGERQKRMGLMYLVTNSFVINMLWF
jgi:hypothetical protein